MNSRSVKIVKMALSELNKDTASTGISENEKKRKSDTDEDVQSLVDDGSCLNVDQKIEIVITRTENNQNDAMADVESINYDDDSFLRMIENAEIVIQETLESTGINNDNNNKFSLNTNSSNSGEKPDKIKYSDIITNECGHNDDIALEYTEQENQENMDPRQDEEMEAIPTKNKREMSTRQNVRKRLCNPDTWKSNIRQKLHQSGKEYVNVRGKKVAAKKIISKKDCKKQCKFKCSSNIGESDRELIFKCYYAMSQNEKYIFLKENTGRYIKGRRTVEEPSRRQYSYKYFFKVQEGRVRVCKQFFLGTLNISQKPIYTVHATEPGMPKKSLRGKTSSRKIREESKQLVIDHIKQFNVVESHYCRANTRRQYLESNLTLSKMYDLYLVKCTENNIQNPVKISMYRRIFNTCFNYGFHKPKKDLCEKCYYYYLRKKEGHLTQDNEDEMEKHISEKKSMREEKEVDKKSGIPVLCFDLENVITCPRSSIGNHFYLPKLTIYNLTGHLSTTNTAYCAIWIETSQGRSGNCLASAIRKIIDRVLQDNYIENLITWSDSCVPQNRNSYIAFCILDILRKHKDLQTITMKYSVPGHGAVQEVDNIHSQIEKHMSLKDFYSPLSFMKELKQVNKKRPFVIMQMNGDDFRNYEECSTKLGYNKVPFTKVTSMRFKSSDLSEVAYKLSHSEHEFIQKVSIAVSRLTRSKKKTTKQNPLEPPLISTLIPAVLPKGKDISKEKISAIKKMMPCMPEVDKQFYRSLLKL